jgi:peptidoglycan-associated lipoprotein
MMYARRYATVALATVVVALSAACGHKAPEVSPTPAVDTAATNAAARAQARADSIARANAAAQAAARADSIRRAQLVADSIANAQRMAADQANLRNTLTTTIYFDFDQSNLKDDAKASLDAKVPLMQANPAARIRIEGNADERGSDEYNLALGQRRAAEAKRYLVSKGIDAGRIDVSSNGEEKPVCQGHDESCWQQNRRDEFVIVAGGDMLKKPSM